MELIAPDILLSLFRTMLRIRRFEEKIVEIYRFQDMKTPVHLCIGQEAVAAGVCAAIERRDYLFTNHRSHGHCLAKGMDPRLLFAELYGRETGCCCGKAGSMHPAAPELGIRGTSAIVGGGIPHAVGAALASKMIGDERIAVVFFGDGASEQGAFHESLSFSALHRLAVIFVCENNLYATNSPLRARQPNGDIFLRAHPYGVSGVQLDGNDVEAVYVAARQAVRVARAGGGPSLMECRTYRWTAHVGPEPDFAQGCRPEGELREWMRRCPIARLERRLQESSALDAEHRGIMEREIDAEIEAALQFAKKSPFPDPSDLLKDVFATNTKD